MANLVMQPTSKTPYINFDSQSGLFEIKGMSCAEYALEFYRPIVEWLNDYVSNPSSKTTVHIELQYFNTSSAKCILQLLEKIAILQEKKKPVEVNWYYTKDDEQMVSDGENYSIILGLPFNLKELE
jgi:hypothetical protein